VKDVLIIGGGLSGLFAACLASKRSLSTTIVMKGRGGLSLSHGAIELYDRSSPSRTISNQKPPHPYALAGKANLVNGIKEFIEITGHSGIHYDGGRSSNMRFLSATGSERRAAYLPRSYIAGELSALDQRLVLGSFEVLRDFQTHLASVQSKSILGFQPAVIPLPLLQPFTFRELYPTDAAKTFDDLDWAVENARSWKPLLVGASTLGLPAILGLRNHQNVIEAIEEVLSVPVFEIPTLPPSIPGLRLELALRSFATNHGAQIIEGPEAKGRAQKSTKGYRSAGVLLDNAGHQSVITSKVTILATGSFLNGGLVATQNNHVLEPVFNIPVPDVNDDRRKWTQKSIFDPHAYARLGIAVDSNMQPLDIHGEVLLENLYAAGGIIQGSDRTLEGTRQGIDIATANCAVKHLCRRLT
jgi:glycerol-3-phosphate dehydrogenase subunit B